MANTRQIITTSVTQALQELRVNKLRTFLSLLGITIGIFCIIAVLTVLDSMKNNIRTEMASLGSDVLYVNRWPWMDEGGEYKWWEYWRRPSMTSVEVKAVEDQVPDASFATLCFPLNNLTIKHADLDISGITGYGVMNDFDKIQNIEIANGRYLSASDIDGGSNDVVLGAEVYNSLFPTGINALGTGVTFFGKKFNVIGVMKKVGKNMAGFDFDNAVIFPYYSVGSYVDTRSFNYDPLMIIKARNGVNIDELKYEVEGVLRRVRKVRPGQANDFAINQLSQVSERIDAVFVTIDVIAIVIGGFSLIVGAFGIANIMFVTVKERTKIIGLKKAIGARSKSILMEFLIEAITLCIMGGLIGIVVVLLLSLALTYGADFTVTLSLKNFLLGIGISAAVGVLAGFIPARAASRLDPVVAIRSN
ncbi:MAG: ABC transporter permease [Bacteroidetes bacterium]|nr:ABC transporter permease [Bacteroidota bacterium]